MKIKELTLFEYGKFNSKTVVKLSENRPNLIYGKNEAGKSTIVASLIELIFGFEKSKKDKHRYLPWNGERLNIEMEYLNDGHNNFIVKRLLSNSVKSTIQDGLAMKNIGNNTIDEANFISSNIYKNVYMITNSQLKEIETKSFNELQDKLVLNYGNSNVSPKSVIKQLDEDLKNLYNSKSRSNKQVINGLINEVKELKREKKEKINLYTEVRVMKEDIEKLNNKLEELDKKIIEKVNLKNKIMKYLIPIKLIDKIDNLKSNINNYSQYEILSDDILEHYEVLKKEYVLLNRQFGDKEHRINLKNNRIEDISADEKLSLSLKNKIASIGDLEDEMRNASSLIAKNDELITINTKKLKDESDYLFETELDKIVNFDFKEIKTIFYKSKEENVSQSGKGLAIFKVIIILGLLGVGIFTENIYGMVVLGLALLIVVFDYFDRRAKSKNNAEELLKENLKAIGIKDTIIENFTEINLINLDNLNDVKMQNNELLDKRELMVEQILTLKSEHKGMFEQFENVKNLRMLNEILTQAISKTRINIELEEDLEIEKRELKAITNRSLEVENKFNLIKKIIQKIGNGEFKTGYENIQVYLPIKEKIEHYENELSESFNTDQLREELKLIDKAIINEDYLTMIENDIETLQLEKAEKGKHNVKLKTEIEHIVKGDTLDVIDGKIAYKEEEIKKYGFQYDILSIVNQAIIRGDERYREKNQPDVLKLTSEYFEVMTNGEYTHVLIEDNNQMHIKSKTGELISADFEISAGTKNQLYLSFRLALIKYLDQDKEKLPIIFDEAFSNWDSERLELTFNIIRKIAQERQVILLTCKEDNIRNLESYIPDIQKIVI